MGRIDTIKDLKMIKVLSSPLVWLCIVATLFVACSDSTNSNQVESIPTVSVTAGEPAQNLLEFEEILEKLRNDLMIPAVSAAITKNREIVWAKGFGYANVEKEIRATANTSYHLASLTKTFASTVIMQLVEEGLLDLNETISEFGIEVESEGIVRIKHLLTHTSEGLPGTAFKYNGSRFGLLDYVILNVTNKSFCELLVENIIEPLELEHTSPNLKSLDNCLLTWYESIQFAENLAQGYTSDGSREQAYPDYFGTAAGLISSVIDMAKYSIAIDNNSFLSMETQSLIFNPTISNNGNILPYGLGWFVQQYYDDKIIWHYGWWDANSSLVIKVPEQELAFIILANTDMLSRAFPAIGNGDISVSVVAQEFINAFVFGNAVLPESSIFVNE